jgi:hypothetical protein
MGWRCFRIEPTDLSRLSLRRFAYSSDAKACPKGKGYGHDASVVIADAVREPPVRKGGKDGFDPDSRWPAKCTACSYVFQDGDQWQVNYELLYKGAPDGKLYVLRESPPGATWIADWFPDEGPNGQWTGPDGKVWCIMLPSGMEWIVYGHSSGPAKDQKGPKWTVQGVPPDVTVSPSIHQVGHYHGFIRGGIITEDCEGKKFPKWPPTA